MVLSIETALVSILEKLRWRPYSGVGQATFSILGTKLRGSIAIARVEWTLEPFAQYKSQVADGIFTALLQE